MIKPGEIYAGRGGTHSCERPFPLPNPLPSGHAAALHFDCVYFLTRRCILRGWQALRCAEIVAVVHITYHPNTVLPRWHAARDATSTPSNPSTFPIRVRHFPDGTRRVRDATPPFANSAVKLVCVWATLQEG